MPTSSTVPRQTRPTPVPGDDAGRDGFIEDQLQRTILHVKFVDLCSSLMVLAVGVLSFLLIVAVIDHWVLPLNAAGRWTALLVLFVGVAYYFVVVVAPLLVCRINPIYAARAIEQAEPTLKNSLINYLLFRSDRAGVRMGIYQALEQRAASDLSHVSAETAVDRSRMIKIGYVLVTVLALCAAYTILTPKSPFQSVARALAPWADIARPSRVRIENVQPGNANVFQGQTLTVSANCYDLRDGEPVTLFYSSLDGQLSRQTLTMNPVAGGLVRECTLPAESGGFQQDLVYWIQAGDATTPSYRARVSPAPSILVERIEYAFPSYTRLSHRVTEDRGDIQAVEGTRITLHARANQAIAAAVLEFDPSSSGNGAYDVSPIENGLSLDDSASHIEMNFAKQEAWCSFYLEMDEARLKPKYQSYHVRFLSEDGHANPHPVLHRLRVVRDLPPEIEILNPAVDRLEIAEDGSQRIEIRAIDPDFGLSQVLLRAVAGGQQIVDAPLVEDDAGQVGQVIVHFDFQPRALGLRAGDAVTCWAIAADNRRSPATGDATPNHAKTREVAFVILPPERTAPVDPDRPEDEPTDETATQETATQQTATQETPPDEETPSNDDSADDEGGSSADSDKSDEGDESPEGGESGSTGDSSEGAGTGEDSGTSQQSGASGGAEGEQSGGDSSDANAGGSSSSGSSPSDGSSGTAGGQSGSSGGNSTGNPSAESSQNGGMSEGSEGASGGAGRREEPLHDGEVFEKTMEYLRQKDDGRAAGSSDQPPGPNAEASDRPNDAASQQPSDSDMQGADAGESSDSESSPGDGQPETSGTGDQQGRPSDEPAPGAEPSPQAAGKQKADQPGAKSEAGGASKPQDGTEQAGSPSTGSDSPQGQKKKSGSPSGNPGQSGAGDQRDPTSGQGGQQESTSGSSSEKKPDGKKKSGAGGSQSQSSNQPETPSPSQPQSSSQGEESSDRSGGGGSGAGQGANQAGTDAAGSNSPSDSGAGAAEQSGTGEASQNAGDAQDAIDATGQTGREPGAGSDTKPGIGGSGGVGAQGNSDQNSQTPPVAPATSEGQPNKGGPGVPYGGGMPSTGELQGFGITGEVPPGEKPNVEYARKATDMVLEYLKDQQQDPDQTLLDELGWSQDDMRAFVERWETLKRSAVEDPASRSELDAALRSLGLRSDSTSPRSGSAPDDSRRGARNMGTRSTPPSAYAEQFNAYRKGTARTRED